MANFKINYDKPCKKGWSPPKPPFFVMNKVSGNLYYVRKPSQLHERYELLRVIDGHCCETPLDNLITNYRQVYVELCVSEV